MTKDGEGLVPLAVLHCELSPQTPLFIEFGLVHAIDRRKWDARLVD